MEIKSISNLGLVTLQFSEDMLVPSNFTEIDSSVLEIKLLPGIENDEIHLGFTWEVVDFDG